MLNAVHSKFFKAKSENCYFCATQPLFFISALCGISSIYVKCEHKNSNNRYTISYSFWLISATMINFFLMLITAILCLREIFFNRPSDKLLLFKLMIDTLVNAACSFTIIVFLMNSKHKKIQLEGICNLLQNGELYCLPTIISYESVCRLRTRAWYYFLTIILIDSINTTYNLLVFPFTFNLATFRHFMVSFCSTYYFALDFSYIIECHVYRDILRRCYARLTTILPKAEKTISNPRYTAKVSCITMMESSNTEIDVLLRNISKFYMAVIANLQLYNSYLSSLFTYSIPSFIGLLILIVFALLKFAFTNNRSDVLHEYIVIAFTGQIASFLLIFMAKEIESLKEPVSCHIFLKLFRFAQLKDSINYFP